MMYDIYVKSTMLRYMTTGEGFDLESVFRNLYTHLHLWVSLVREKYSQIAKFMGPTWGTPGSCRPQMGPMLLSGPVLESRSWLAFTATFTKTSLLMFNEVFPCEYLITGGITLQNALANNDEKCKWVTVNLCICYVVTSSCDCFC